eukprot:7312875-Prymnesium_polylepis.1
MLARVVEQLHPVIIIPIVWTGKCLGRVRRVLNLMPNATLQKPLNDCELVREHGHGEGPHSLLVRLAKPSLETIIAGDIDEPLQVRDGAKLAREVYRQLTIAICRLQTNLAVEYWRIVRLTHVAGNRTAVEVSEFVHSVVGVVFVRIPKNLVEYAASIIVLRRL